MIDKKFIFYLVCNLILSCVLSYLLTDTIIKNTDAMNLIASTFSILSGVVLMVLTTIGELFLFSPNESSTSKSKKYKNFEIRFSRLSLLFVTYLIILLLILIYYLIKDILLEELIIDLNWLKINPKSIIGHIIIFFSFFCFIISVYLPWIYKQLLEEKNGIKY